MKIINYESDFKIIEGFKDKSPIATAPFRFSYYTKMSKRTYVAEYDGLNYTNCRPTDDDRIVVAFDNHKLGMGVLNVKREFFLTDKDFADGICNLVSVETTGITLDSGATDEIDDIVIEVFPFYQQGETGKSAYQEWLDLGNEGTVADFLASLKGDKGEDGKSFTYDDMTDAEKEDLAGHIPEGSVTEEKLSQEVQDKLNQSGGGYEPPVGGIPKKDLSQEVQASLGKADTALQEAFAENLLLNARFSNNAEKWYGGGYQVVNDIHGRGVSGVKLDEGYVEQYVDVEEGYHTLSFWHTGLYGENYVYVNGDCEEFESDLGEVGGGGEYILPNRDSPKKHTIRFFAYKGTLAISFESGGEMSISEVKLEKSKKASDFSLNTSDIADKYATPTKDEVATAIANAITNTLNTEV